MEQLKMKAIKLPGKIFLRTRADFSRWEAELIEVADKFLSRTWKWTFKIGGKVHNSIKGKKQTTDVCKEIEKELEKHKMVNMHIKKEENVFPAHEGVEEGGDGGGGVSPGSPPKQEASSSSSSSSSPRQEEEEPLFHRAFGAQAESKTYAESVKFAESAQFAVNPFVAAALGRKGWEAERLLAEGDEFFWDTILHTIESTEMVAVRKEIWRWMVACLEGEAATKGFCAHLVRETDIFDIAQLYTNVKNFLNTENYRELDDRLGRVYTARPTQGEDIFSFIGRLVRLKEEVMQLDYLGDVDGGKTIIPEILIVTKILRAAEGYQEYQFFTEALIASPKKEWVNLTVSKLRDHLLSVHSNRASLAKGGEAKGGVGLFTEVRWSSGPRGSVGVSFSCIAGCFPHVAFGDAREATC
jgi:hypothetical protein